MSIRRDAPLPAALAGVRLARAGNDRRPARWPASGWDAGEWWERPRWPSHHSRDYQAERSRSKNER
jgi:hypothetical protein